MHLFVAVLSFLILCGCNDVIPTYKNPDASIDERVEDLLSRMTLEEKIYQMNMSVLGRSMKPNNIRSDETMDFPQFGSFITYSSTDPVKRNELQRQALEETRLGIPIVFAYDAIHGFRTTYPIPLAQACSWNPKLVEMACSISAREMRTAGIEWTFSPMVDIARDGRWGRCAEGYGEDPYASSVFCAAAVRGYQGTSLSDTTKVASCLKHYIGYGASEGGRDYVPTEISRQTLWDTYMPPFEAGVRAGAASLMSSFNSINGTPVTSSDYLLSHVPRQKWEWDGVVVSDYDAVKQLIYQGAAENHADCAVLAANAGLDMDMADMCYANHLEQAVIDGLVNKNVIDDAVRRILRLKFELGLFERPYTPSFDPNEKFTLPEDIDVVEQLAEESFVLLKNDGVLPLDEKPGKIALIGPAANSYWQLIGSWGGHPVREDIVNIYDGMVAEFGEAAIRYVHGCGYEGDDRSGFSEAIAVARKSDVIVLCLGEEVQWSGENGSRSTIALPKIQEDLAAELHALGKPIILLLVNGRPLELCRLDKMTDAILELWQPGIRGGNPAAGILSGRLNPSGRLSITFPYSSGQIPIYYNRRRTSRPFMGHYQDVPREPMYWFGHGLSYSEYEYGDIRKVSDNPMVFEIDVTNVSDRDGKETVFWYVTDPVNKVTRPYKELKFFEKRTIAAGSKEIFHFTVDPIRDFSYVDEEGNRYLEKGKYIVSVSDKAIEVEL